jgi:hypothetical protein
MRWVLHGCPVCGGDLHEDLQDQGWLTCFMCAREFPVSNGCEARAMRRGGGRKRSRTRIVKDMPYGPSLTEDTRRAA